MSNPGEALRLIEITSADDPRLADYRDLRDVQLRQHLEAEHGLFIAEGEKVVRRAVEAGFEPRSYLMAERWLDGLADVLARSEAPVYVVSEALAEEVTGFHVHRGALASLHRRPLPTVDEVLAGARSVLVLEDVVDHANVTTTSPTRRSVRRVAVLEGLVDHGNVGSVFRNAAALGIDAVLVNPTSADPLYRRAIKTSMGNVFNVPWTRCPAMDRTLKQLKDDGYTTVALTLTDDAIDLDDLVAMELGSIALVLGNEGSGIDPRTIKQADLRVKIPMAGRVDSLNVAAASAIVFYALRSAAASPSSAFTED